MVRNFYPDLEEAVQIAEKELEQVKIEDEVSDVVCDQCGRRMVIKYGPHGKFLACPGFPECKNTKTYFEKIGVSCPKCGKDIVIRKTRCGEETVPGQGKWCGLLGRDTEYIIGWKCVRQIGADIILVDVCMEEIMRRCEG